MLSPGFSLPKAKAGSISVPISINKTSRIVNIGGIALIVKSGNKNGIASGILELKI